MAGKVTFVNKNDETQLCKVNFFGAERDRVRVANVLSAFKACAAIMEDGTVIEDGEDGLSMDTFVAGCIYSISVQPVNPKPQGNERSPKRSKISGNGFSESVNVVLQKWKSKLSTFLGTFVEKRCKLPEKSGVPCDHRGLPSILLDKLTEGWTKDVGVLWDRLKDSSCGIVPVLGVSGSGKTRFLYELLAENWGFFWTATTRGNGGSSDVGTMLFRQLGEDTAENHRIATGRMRCAIISRLLILQFCVQEIPALKPLQWLMLQVQFRAFSDEACEELKILIICLLLTLQALFLA